MVYVGTLKHKPVLFVPNDIGGQCDRRQAARYSTERYMFVASPAQINVTSCQTTTQTQSTEMVLERHHIVSLLRGALSAVC